MATGESDDIKAIVDPRETDVLCGRGGAALRHPGNQTYRKLVNLNKPLYITCPKTEKLKISRSIVAAIREQNGRFLERDKDKGVWCDIGDKKAIEKTSQALREGQPKLRKKMVEEGRIPADQVNGDNDPRSASSMQQQPMEQYGNGIYNPRSAHLGTHNDMNGMNGNGNMNYGMGMERNMNNFDRAGSGNYTNETIFALMQQQQLNQTMNMGRNYTGNLRNNMTEMPPPAARMRNNNVNDEKDLMALRNMSLDSKPGSIPSWTPSYASKDSFAMGMSLGDDIPHMVTNRNRSRNLSRNMAYTSHHRNDFPADGANHNGGFGINGVPPSVICDKIGSFDPTDESPRQQLYQQYPSMGRDSYQSVFSGNKNNADNQRSPKRSPKPSVKDRRRNFASMKSGSFSTMDISMVDSTFSLLSNLSAHGSKHQGRNAMEMAISTHNGRKDSMGSEFIGVGSRRSFMSGMSKLSGHAFDMNSTLSNRKFSGNTMHTTSSRSFLSDFSGIEEDDFAGEEFDWETPKKN
mmetsp:Transcript_712/g.1697  ORF Transcript_712/g.1697 Transcript_712/m.1697 type:complete len:519 (-) Transcript_712:612-2168(-)|eukprot:CAMPEP_0172371782 /NCGR_PEP_ID=MMETSP1060-20121228/44827_1 /TAXON_ID=37318 /ORGANISM="Pseudo-nitzschia pungens, Strain cf. cingulata" /LENGTH=518 /DNA_ID=CAMNT_0013097525 /DNA_START=153 /DNA_END=1709 /DNA_ORIENTATION=+